MKRTYFGYSIKRDTINGKFIVCGREGCVEFFMREFETKEEALHFAAIYAGNDKTVEDFT